MNLLQRLVGWLFGWRVQVSVRVELAALAGLCGGMEEAYLLQRVIDWCQSNDRRESKRHLKEGHYWMYYSYREWAEKELTWLTARQVEPIISRLESKGLLIGKVFEEGGCKWYRPNMEKVAGVGEPKGKIVPFPPSRIRETPYAKRETPSRIGDTPFTNRGNIKDSNQSYSPSSSPNDSSNQESGSDKTRCVGFDDADKRFSKSGIDDGYLRREYGAEAVESAMRKINNMIASGKTIRDVGAYMATILKNERTNSKLDGNPLMRDLMRRSNPTKIQTPARGVEDTAPQPASKSAEAEKWALTMGQLEIHLDRANFQTWVQDCELVSADGGVWTVRAKSAMARDMLEHRLYKIVREMAGRVVGAEVELRFVVNGEAVAS